MQVLIGHDDNVRRVAHSCGRAADVGEDDFGDQHVSGVQIEHLTQSLRNAKKESNVKRAPNHLDSLSRTTVSPIDTKLHGIDTPTATVLKTPNGGT